MHVFIDKNEFFEDSIKESLKYNYIPVVLYNITYNNKNQFKDDLQKIISQKRKLSYLSAIRVKLLKIDNSVPGFINSLKMNFDILIGMGGMNKINRFFIEQTSVDFLLDPHSSEYYSKIDFIHHFNSGLNHVLCKAANQNNIRFFFSLNFTGSKQQVLKEIGRINQNIGFASKYKIKILVNFIIQKPQHVKSKIELLSILSMFDISTIQKSQSFNVIGDLLQKRQEYEKIISDDIRFV